MAAALDKKPDTDARLAAGEFDLAALAEIMAGAGSDGCLLIGHEPDLSEVIGVLTGAK